MTCICFSEEYKRQKSGMFASLLGKFILKSKQSVTLILNLRVYFAGPEFNSKVVIDFNLVLVEVEHINNHSDPPV